MAPSQAEVAISGLVHEIEEHVRAGLDAAEPACTPIDSPFGLGRQDELRPWFVRSWEFVGTLEPK